MLHSQSSRGGVSDIVVVVGHRAEDIRTHLSALDLTFAVNPDPDSEMGVSIALGVEAIPVGARALLISPVDYPGVPPRLSRQSSTNGAEELGWCSPNTPDAVDIPS